MTNESKDQKKKDSANEVKLIEDLRPDSATDGLAKVLVYGSLKQSCGNHCLMERVGAKWLGYDSISGDFSMISFGGFPGVVRRPEQVGSVTTIFGELYAVDTEGLASLDMLESHPDWYERIKYRTDVLDRRAWMYTLPMGEGYNNADHYSGVDECIWQPTSEELSFWNSQEGITLALL